MQRRKDIRKQAERLTAGQINRRRFVMSALATGVTMPTAMSLATKAEAQTPRKGGHLSISMQSGREFDALVEFATGNTLTEVSDGGDIVGDLARAVASENNGTLWIVELSHDATFSDGTPLVASHVVESLERTQHPLLADVQEIKATAPDQVVFRLQRPDTHFPARLTAPGLSIRILSADGERLGTGGYVVENQTETGLHLKRRPDYWKANRAHVESVSLVRAVSQAALQAEVMAGHVDYATGIAPETVAFLAHLPNVEVTTFPATRALILAPTGFGNQTRARDAIRALRSSIDREAFIGRALLGQGRPGDDTVMVPTAPSSDDLPAPPALTSPTAPLLVAASSTMGWLPHLVDIAKDVGVSLDATTSPGADALLRAQALGQLDFACDPLADCGDLFVPAWANDLAAQSTRLVRPAQISPNLPNDGHRMIERWWLA